MKKPKNFNLERFVPVNSVFFGVSLQKSMPENSKFMEYF